MDDMGSTSRTGGARGGGGADRPALACDRFDELLPDYLEDALGAQDRTAVEAHAAACARCGPLLADLAGIRLAAARLPELAPARDLWQGISARIAAPVIPLEPTGPLRSAARRPRQWTWSPAWLGAAAAALVAVTAGVTYQLTVRATGGTQGIAVADREPSVRVPVTTAPAGPAEVPSGAGPQVAVAPSPPPSTAPSSGSAPPPSAPGARALVRNVARPAVEAEATYDREVDALNRILRDRRGTLNPETVRVLEQNLRIIDRAIRQSRTALAKDPASEFLSRQLNTALEKKLELLRTAALLPTT